MFIKAALIATAIGSVYMVAARAPGATDSAASAHPAAPTVRDPGTGQVSKVSSASSYSWLDASGKTAYQTSDPNANPNGTLQGTWTLQQKVHGDGTP